MAKTGATKKGKKPTGLRELEDGFTHRLLIALLNEYADRAEIDKNIGVMTRTLASIHGIPASYPPTE
jgi:hypothetical protein